MITGRSRERFQGKVQPLCRQRVIEIDGVAVAFGSDNAHRSGVPDVGVQGCSGQRARIEPTHPRCVRSVAGRECARRNCPDRRRIVRRYQNTCIERLRHARHRPGGTNRLKQRFR